MRKIIFFLFFEFIFLFFPRNLYAQSNFIVDANIEYKIHENGNTTVTNTITLKNINEKYYAKYFYLNLTSIEPKNIRAFESGSPLSLFQEKINDTLRVRVDFDEAVIGAGEKRSFIISYEEDSFTQHSGEIWEISIPKIDNSSFRNLKVSISVPKTFGILSYFSPDPEIIKETLNKYIYFFKKEDIEREGIVAGFGQFQVFYFTLDYHLENPLNNKSKVEIAIPPDTSLQKLFYKNIEPKPIDVIRDEDGNWLGIYEIKKKQRLDIEVSGWVQIFSTPNNLISPSPGNILNNLKPNNFWQSDDPQIRELSKNLKTPQNIYNYVTKTLTYNFKRIEPNANRLGAIEALNNPGNALCTEFTDLFIALARAAGIPAREINGYAYTENQDLQPLSLVADVLHAWPEYWNEENKTWISVDPTWSATSGVDFFSKLDLRHFAFVIHGKDPIKPYSAGTYKLGSNPQKDVFVKFDKLPDERMTNTQISYSVLPGVNLFQKKLKVIFKNEGPSALYQLSPKIYFDNNIVFSQFFEILPPFSKYETEIIIPFGLLATRIPKEIVIKAGKSEVLVPTDANRVIIYQLLILFVFLVFVLIYLFLKTGKFQKALTYTKFKSILKYYEKKISKIRVNKD